MDLWLGLHRVAHLAVQELVLLVGVHRWVWHSTRSCKLKWVLLDGRHEAKSLVLVSGGHRRARLAKHSSMVLHVWCVLTGWLAALMDGLLLSFHVVRKHTICLRAVALLLLTMAVVKLRVVIMLVKHFIDHHHGVLLTSVFYLVSSSLL